MTAINSAIAIDLTGQVCADSIGWHLYSGVGGQMDFVRGAALAPEGRAIIALPSTAADGTRLAHHARSCAEGAGVVTTRAHVRTVVTEWGVAELYRQEHPGAGPGADRHRPPGLPRRADRARRARRTTCRTRTRPRRPTPPRKTRVVDAARPLRRPPRAEVSPAFTTGGRAEWP